MKSPLQRWGPLAATALALAVAVVALVDSRQTNAELEERNAELEKRNAALEQRAVDAEAKAARQADHLLEIKRAEVREKRLADRERRRALREKLTERRAELGENEFLLSKSAFKKAVADPALARDARVVPHVEDGRPNGFKVLELDRRSKLHRWGFEVDDIVNQLNGVQIRNEEEVLAVWEADDLGNADEFEIGVLRDGEQITLHYELIE